MVWAHDDGMQQHARSCPMSIDTEIQPLGLYDGSFKSQTDRSIADRASVNLAEGMPIFIGSSWILMEGLQAGAL